MSSSCLPTPSVAENEAATNNIIKKKKKKKSLLLTPVVLSILVMETGERFAYYGFRAVLTLYFVHELQYTENQAIAMFAYTTALAYLSPILGALLADGRWGRFTTIVVFGTVYVIGLVVLTCAACFVNTTNTNNNNNNNNSEVLADDDEIIVVDDNDQLLQLKNALTLAGLLLICLGTGGIKPCVSAFGADQVVQTIDHDDTTVLVAPTPPPPTASTNTATDTNTTSTTSEQRGLLCNNGCGSSAIPEEIELDDFITESCPPDARETTGEILLMDTPNRLREEQVRVFFACFYFCINVGAVTSIAIIPTVRGAFGFGAAFFVPTIFMMIAMTLFLSMSHKYVHHNPGDGEESSSLSTTFALCWYLLKKNTWPFIPKFMRRCFPCLRPDPTLYMKHHTSQYQQQETTTSSIPVEALGVEDKKDVADELVTEYKAHDDDAFEYDSQQQHRNEALEEHFADAKQALRVLPIMALTPLFWMLYDQQSSVWVLQAARMKLPLGLEPEQMNAVNPIQIMIFIPLFDRVIYPFLDRYRFNIRPLRRMAVGMLLCAMAFFTSGLLESVIQNREETAMMAQTMQGGDVGGDDEPAVELVNVFWQVPQITLLSIAEIFVSVTGMEFVYAASPQRLKSSLTALFLLTTAVGDFLSGVLYSTVFQQLNRVWIMHICGGLMMINLFLFIGVARWWEEREAVRNMQQQHHQHPVSTRSSSNDNTAPPTSSDSKQGLIPVQQGQLT